MSSHPVTEDRLDESDGQGTPPARLSRCVVFDGTGFVGRSVVERLRSSGRYGEVVALGSRDVDVRDGEAVSEAILPGNDLVNASGYARATDTSPEGRALHKALNVAGAANIVNAAHQRGARRLVHISSVAAQGPIAGIGLTEDDCHPPMTPYAQSKLDGEKAIQGASGPTPTVVLRPTSVYGPDRGLTKVLEGIANLPVLFLPNRGRTLVPFCHVENVAHAVQLALEITVPPVRPVLVAAKRSVALAEALAQLRSPGKQPMRIVTVPARLFRFGATVTDYILVAFRKGPVFGADRLRILLYDTEFDPARARAELGYEPVIDGFASPQG